MARWQPGHSEPVATLIPQKMDGAARQRSPARRAQRLSHANVHRGELPVNASSTELLAAIAFACKRKARAAGVRLHQSSDRSDLGKLRSALARMLLPDRRAARGCRQARARRPATRRCVTRSDSNRRSDRGKERTLFYARPGIGRQAIAAAPHGLDQAIVLRGLERTAQAADVHIDRAFLDENMVAPHLVE